MPWGTSSARARCVGSSSSPSSGSGCVNADSFLQTQQAPLEAPKLQLIQHREPRAEGVVAVVGRSTVVSHRDPRASAVPNEIYARRRFACRRSPQGRDPLPSSESTRVGRRDRLRGRCVIAVRLLYQRRTRYTRAAQHASTFERSLRNPRTILAQMPTGETRYGCVRTRFVTRATRQPVQAMIYAFGPSLPKVRLG